MVVGGIALHHDYIEWLHGQNRIERRQHARRDLRESLSGLHQIEIVVGTDLESGQHLVQHGAVLRSGADAHIE